MARRPEGRKKAARRGPQAAPWSPTSDVPALRWRLAAPQDILRVLQPARPFHAVAKGIFNCIWEMRGVEAMAARKTIETPLADTSTQIDSLLDRIMASPSPSVIGAHEKRIESWSVRRSGLPSRPSSERRRDA